MSVHTHTHTVEGGMNVCLPPQMGNVMMAFLHTVQRNHMRFGGIVAPNSGCLNLTLGLCSSISFGVVSVLLSRFDAPLKCTVNKTL